MYKPDQINKLSLKDVMTEIENIYKMELYDQTVSGLSNREVEIVKDYERNLRTRCQKVSTFPWNWKTCLKKKPKSLINTRLVNF